ncbi:flagellin [Candidatus Neomarinimicrobiota bacterium]
MSLSRIRFNFVAYQSLNELREINSFVSSKLLNLSSGKRINSVGDDPAGFSLARGLESRRVGLQQALSNVGNAQNILSIAEGGYQAVGDLLVEIKEKAIQAADDSYTSTQRTAIQNQIDALVEEIDDIVEETTYQDTALIDGSFASKLFQTGASAGDTFSVTLLSADSAALSVNSLSVSDAAAASTAISTIDAAITNLNTRTQDAGEYTIRLEAKESMLTVVATNTEAARSRIEDADFAKEQLELIQAQIIQQTAYAAYGQANLAPQLVLTLF